MLLGPTFTQILIMIIQCIKQFFFLRIQNRCIFTRVLILCIYVQYMWTVGSQTPIWVQLKGELHVWKYMTSQEPIAAHKMWIKRGFVLKNRAWDLLLVISQLGGPGCSVILPSFTFTLSPLLFLLSYSRLLTFFPLHNKHSLWRPHAPHI